MDFGGKENEIIVFTDGSASVKTKQGGFGVFFAHPITKTIAKGFHPTKIGRMESMALLYAIMEVDKSFDGTLTIYSDSQYVVNSINMGWARRWKEEGWFGRKNVDIWRGILHEIDERPNMTLNLKHLKGHQKDIDDPLIFGNNVADRLADYKSHKNYIQEHPETWEI